MGIRIQPDPEPERNLLRRSDHYSFMQIGVPAVGFVFGYEKGSPDEAAYREWYAKRYHSPLDDLNQPWVPGCRRPSSTTSSISWWRRWRMRTGGRRGKPAVRSPSRADAPVRARPPGRALAPVAKLHQYRTAIFEPLSRCPRRYHMTFGGSVHEDYQVSHVERNCGRWRRTRISAIPP
jgi:hypothetical protein